MEADGKYLDGCLRTRGKCEHAQGYYVARVRKQPGHWSAFWLDNAPVGKVNDRGRDGAEIEISGTTRPSPSFRAVRVARGFMSLVVMLMTRVHEGAKVGGGCNLLPQWASFRSV